MFFFLVLKGAIPVHLLLDHSLIFALTTVDFSASAQFSRVNIFLSINSNGESYLHNITRRPMIYQSIIYICEDSWNL